LIYYSSYVKNANMLLFFTLDIYFVGSYRLNSRSFCVAGKTE